MAEVFLPLLLNYRWFKRHRMNADFTFSWGTDNEDDGQLLRVCGKAGAVHESGLDNSPLFDEMELQDGKLDFACIDLSCLMYRACEVLLRFTAILGSDDATRSRDELRLDSARFRRALRDFFSAEKSIVNSFRRRNGTRVYARTLTPLCFYPLLTNTLDAAEVDLLVHLFRSSDFTGSAAMLPSLSFNDPRFDGDGDYWRGRIWPPLVYLYR